jgi:hypothetical protein
MMSLRYGLWLRIGTSVAAACAAPGCGGKSGSGMPDGGMPATDITVRVFPDGVPMLDSTTANADLLAFQDGDGDWTEATGTDGVYHLRVTGDRYGVAVGCGSQLGGTEIYYQSVVEAAELAVNGCVRLTPHVNVVVMIGSDGVSPTNFADVWIGGSFVPGMPGSTQSTIVPRGLQDIYASASPPVGGPDVSFIVYRAPALDLEMDQTLTIDWSRGAVTELFPLTVSDPASLPGTWGMTSNVVTPHGHGIRTLQIDFGQPPRYAAVAAAVRQPGDITRVEVTETGLSPGEARSAFQEMATPAAVTLAPADYLSATAPTIDTNAVSQLSAAVPLRASKLGHTVSAASFTTNTIVEQHYLRLFVRPGWAGNAASVLLHAPDLRNCASWTTDMELTARTEVDWVLSVLDQDQPLDAPIGQGRIAVESTVSGKTSPGQRTSAAAAPGRSPFARRMP